MFGPFQGVGFPHRRERGGLGLGGGSWQGERVAPLSLCPFLSLWPVSLTVLIATWKSLDLRPPAPLELRRSRRAQQSLGRAWREVPRGSREKA